MSKFERTVHTVAMLLIILWLGIMPIVAVFTLGAVINNLRDTPTVTDTTTPILPEDLCGGGLCPTTGE
jgi:hypothetical protein